VGQRSGIEPSQERQSRIGCQPQGRRTRHDRLRLDVRLERTTLGQALDLRGSCRFVSEAHDRRPRHSHAGMDRRRRVLAAHLTDLPLPREHPESVRYPRLQTLFELLTTGVGLEPIPENIRH
jgi:hypothetical protein